MKRSNDIVLAVFMILLFITIGTFNSCTVDLDDAYIVAVTKDADTWYPTQGPAITTTTYTYEVDNPFGINAVFTSDELLYQVGDHLLYPTYRREDE